MSNHRVSVILRACLPERIAIITHDVVTKGCLRAAVQDQWRNCNFPSAMPNQLSSLYPHKRTPCLVTPRPTVIDVSSFCCCAPRRCLTAAPRNHGIKSTQHGDLSCVHVHCTARLRHAHMTAAQLRFSSRFSSLGSHACLCARAHMNMIVAVSFLRACARAVSG